MSRLPASSSCYLTDAQRDALDAETKSIIRSTLSLITRLESAEKIRVQTEARLFKQKHSSLKAIWADESVREAEAAAMNIVTAHREGIVWFLKNRLEQASEEQRERQEIRLNRQIERGKSLLHMVPGMKAGLASGGVAQKAGATVGKIAVEEEEERQAMAALSPDQLRIFEKENDGMMKHYEDTLEQVRYVLKQGAPGFRLSAKSCSELPKTRSWKSQSSRHSSRQTSPRKTCILRIW